MALSCASEFNKKYGDRLSKMKGGKSKSNISKLTGIPKRALDEVYDKGVGAYKTNPKSVRPQVKSKEQWAMARVYASINPKSKAYKIDKSHLKK